MSPDLPRFQPVIQADELRINRQQPPYPAAPDSEPCGFPLCPCGGQRHSRPAFSWGYL